MQHLAHRWQVNACLIIIASCRILWCIIPCQGTYDSPWFGALVCGDWSMVDFDSTRLQRGNIALQLQLQLQQRHTSLHSMCHIIGFARVELSPGRTLVAHREGAFVRVIQCRRSCPREWMPLPVPLPLTELRTSSSRLHAHFSGSTPVRVHPLQPQAVKWVQKRVLVFSVHQLLWEGYSSVSLPLSAQQ